MKVFYDLEHIDSQDRSGALSIGNFDGAHRGHALIIQRLREQAQRVGGPATIFTFDPHPGCLLRPDAAPAPLTCPEQKIAAFQQLGVDAVIVYPTDQDLLDLSAGDFFQRVACDQLDAKALVEGANFGFGRGREGDVHALRRLCDQAGARLTVVPPVEDGGRPVSSSRIRESLFQGDVQAAAGLLGRPYQLLGKVVRGAGRGATIGFPTANLAEICTLLPAAGVYAGTAARDDRTWPAAINVGPNPTFGEHALKLEVHLIDDEIDLYGQRLKVDFVRRLRDIRRFDGVESLQAQLRQDVDSARSALA
ncbi:MAG: bifunctional riboflavin kinase/FAD synthetase [Planctomycetales bacterium]